MKDAEIAAKIRDALYEIEAGTPRGVDKGMQMLDSLVSELEAEN